MIKASDYKVFILSENITYRNNLASKLRIEGINVEFASGGFHFLHLLERNRSEVTMLVCHEDMLDMSAEEIISITRLSRPKNDLPILYISKNNDEENVCDMILNGANEFILQSNNMLPAVERIKKLHPLFKRLKAS